MKVLHRYKAVITVVIILLVAAFFRLYHIADYMTFLGDEGRDVLVVRGILHGHLVFLGPRASAGDFFLGPIYYYMMAPFLWLFNYNPVGPAVMVALLSVATVYLLYYIGKEFFSEKAGLVAAAIYAVSPLVILYSHSSWNPNPVPFFTLLSLYILYKAVKLNSWRLFLIAGFLFGILIQLHYIIVFLGVIVTLFILLGTLLYKRKKTLIENLVNLVKEYALSFVGFLVGFSPFLAFEIKNNFPNFRTIIRFVTANTVGHATTGASFWFIVSNTFMNVFGRLVIAFPFVQDIERTDPFLFSLWQVATVIIGIGSLVALLRVKDKLFRLLLLLWIGLGILLFGFYKKSIYDYYYGFLFPAPALLFGNLFMQIYDEKRFRTAGKILSVGAVVLILGVNLWHNQFRQLPNKQLAQMRSISQFVLAKTNGKPFNFALVTGGNSDEAYRYFFAVENHDPVTIQNTIVDPKRTSVTNQLLVVCETITCQPLGHPLFEIAGFGRAEITGHWDLSINDGNVYLTPSGQVPFVEVYRLGHYHGK